ncbi:hypothetical protein GCM10020254_39230 [Streptomyces goshikiensis]
MPGFGEPEAVVSGLSSSPSVPYPETSRNAPPPASSASTVTAPPHAHIRLRRRSFAARSLRASQSGSVDEGPDRGKGSGKASGKASGAAAAAGGSWYGLGTPCWGGSWYGFGPAVCG